MRWLGGIGGEKCGGGWYDWLGTTEHTYVEQARQTVLAGARESMLFHFGGLHHETGPADIEALRNNIPELLAIAREVQRREPVGIAAYKPPNSSPEDEPRVFDYAGMIGLPLVPCHQFPTNSPAAFLSVHALTDLKLPSELGQFIQTGRPVLLTDGLARRIGNQVNLTATNVHVLNVQAHPDSLIELSQARLDDLRAPLLSASSSPRPVGVEFIHPRRVGGGELQQRAGHCRFEWTEPEHRRARLDFPLELAMKSGRSAQFTKPSRF
jgi:hypothetical protein